MQRLTIGPNQAGQRLDKFLHKYLPEAGAGFLYKMLRKKNITLNGKKAEGKEMLQQGDEVAFYFAEETFLKFVGKMENTETGGSDAGADRPPRLAEYEKAYREIKDIQVIYEDKDIVALDKPVGVLTQKASASDLSLNEWLIGYLLEKGDTDAEELHSFKPSVCNRLDRNTSGLVLCGKSLAGSQDLSKMIRERSISKYYLTICSGEMREEQLLDGYLVKDGRTNRVTVMQKSPSGNVCEADCRVPDNASYIRTAYRPITAANGFTLLEVDLITGKPHQIRAHLASIGHPVIGDYKYGNRQLNDRLKKEYGLESQLLHAGRVVFPDGREIKAAVPELFARVAAAMKLCRM